LNPLPAIAVILPYLW